MLSNSNKKSHESDVKVNEGGINHYNNKKYKADTTKTATIMKMMTPFYSKNSLSKLFFYRLKIEKKYRTH